MNTDFCVSETGTYFNFVFNFANKSLQKIVSVLCSHALKSSSEENRSQLKPWKTELRNEAWDVKN